MTIIPFTDSIAARALQLADAPAERRRVMREAMASERERLAEDRINAIAGHEATLAEISRIAAETGDALDKEMKAEREAFDAAQKRFDQAREDINARRQENTERAANARSDADSRHEKTLSDIDDYASEIDVRLSIGAKPVNG